MIGNYAQPTVNLMDQLGIARHEIARLDFRYGQLENQIVELGHQQSNILKEKEKWISELALLEVAAESPQLTLVEKPAL